MREENFLITPGRVYVASGTSLEPLHFAAMGYVDYEPEDFVRAEMTFEAPHLLLPPMLYWRRDGLLRLSVDLWRNDWMVTAEPGHVEVPSISREPTFWRRSRE